MIVLLESVIDICLFQYYFINYYQSKNTKCYLDITHINMNLKVFRHSDRFWLFVSLIGFSILYLNLIWKTTESIERLTIDDLF